MQVFTPWLAAQVGVSAAEVGQAGVLFSPIFFEIKEGFPLLSLTLPSFLRFPELPVQISVFAAQLPSAVKSSTFSSLGVSVFEDESSHLVNNTDFSRFVAFRIYAENPQ